MSVRSATGFKQTPFKRPLDDTTAFEGAGTRAPKRVKFDDMRVIPIEVPFSIVPKKDKSSGAVMSKRTFVPILKVPPASHGNFSALCDSNSISESLAVDLAAKILMMISPPNSAFNGAKRIIPSTAPLHALPILVTPSSPYEFNPQKVNEAQPSQSSIQSQPHPDDAIFEQAKKYMDNAEHSLAIEYFSRVAKSHPKFDEVLYYIGFCYDIQDDYENAKKHYLRVSQYSSFIDNAEFRLGLCLFKQSDHSKAKEHFRNVKESSPIEFAYAQFYHGRCSFDTLQYPSAIKHFLRVPETHHLYGEAQYKIGKCYVELDNLLEASNHYNNVPSYHPEFVHAHFSIGVLFFKKGNFAKAEEHFDKVAPLNQEYLEAQNYMASIRWMTRPKSNLNASQPIEIIGD
jgi:tetratricopeptide (TPR) repeat protein